MRARSLRTFLFVRCIVTNALNRPSRSSIDDTEVRAFVGSAQSLVKCDLETDAAADATEARGGAIIPVILQSKDALKIHIECNASNCSRTHIRTARCPATMSSASVGSFPPSHER
jgi:hypothetical protein